MITGTVFSAVVFAVNFCTVEEEVVEAFTASVPSSQAWSSQQPEEQGLGLGLGLGQAQQQVVAM